jgi:hypothetical protein
VHFVSEQNPFVKFAARYFDDPVGFAEHVLGMTPDPWQAELLDAIAAGERKISVVSGHGVGKSTALAIAANWYMATRAPCKIVCTAPSSPQLFDALFAEIKALVTRLPVALQALLEVKAERIEHKGAPTECFITARTSRAENPEALQGIHSEWVMLICDEASGIPDPVFEAGAGSMSGHNAVTILTGNPTRTSGFFYDTQTRLKNSWWTRKVSCLTSGRVSAEFVQDMKERYGEDSNAYRVRVLGEFPRRDDDTLIPLDLVEAACERDIALDGVWPQIWGLDVARFGTDSSALCKRKGKVVLEPVRQWKNLDLMQLVGLIKNEYDLSTEKPLEIMVDVIGVGAGVVDRLRELKLPVRGINVGESPSLGDQHLNLRSELWWKAKAWLESRDCKLPVDDRLKNELTVPKYFFTANGKMKLESKDDMKRRGLRSPDCADAFVLTFASDAATASGAKSWASNWSKPLKRGIKGII